MKATTMGTKSKIITARLRQMGWSPAAVRKAVADGTIFCDIDPNDYVGLKGGVKSATDGVEVEVQQPVGPTRFRQGWEVYHFLFENDRLIGWTEV